MHTRPFFVVLVLTATSVASAFDWPTDPAWEPIYRGVDRLDVVLHEPRPLRVHAIRVDLAEPGVRVTTDQSNGDRPEETDGLKTSTFLTRNGCQIAINGAPFWPGRKHEDEPQNVVGLVVRDGELVSPVDQDKPRAALVFRGPAHAAIERPPIELDGVHTAVGGFGVVLRAGEVVRPQTEGPGLVDQRHPRTAIGLADEGQTLLLVVVDGRQEGYSEGVDLAELGELLHRLGAIHGLNLDGGGTSGMVRSDDAGGFRHVNRPIDGGVPGQERVSASHLGVYAEALESW